MGLLDLFNPRDSDGRGAAAAAAEPVEVARTRARRRLIGAVVLLGIGIVGFPLLFETQPRPIPVDIPIQIPSRDSAPPLALPPQKAVAPKPVAAASSAPAAVVSEAPREPVPPAAVVSPPAAKPDPAPPKADPAPVAAATSVKPDAAGRFVVQVGAFAEASAVREARAKVEKLGLATYTQVVETSGGARTRVRLGPFASREEADKAAGRVKAAGLPAAVLAL